MERPPRNYFLQDVPPPRANTFSRWSVRPGTTFCRTCHLPVVTARQHLATSQRVGVSTHGRGASTRGGERRGVTATSGRDNSAHGDAALGARSRPLPTLPVAVAEMADAALMRHVLQNGVTILQPGNPSRKLDKKISTSKLNQQTQTANSARLLKQKTTPEAPPPPENSARTPRG